MAYNDFIKFATNHRNLLETAIKKYPTALKPSDLVEFDQVYVELKNQIMYSYCTNFIFYLLLKV